MIVIDASILIAHLDPTDAHHTAATALLRDTIDEDRGMSVLTIAECLVRPVRAGVAATVERALDRLEIAALSLDADQARQLAETRAQTGLRMPDAVVIHAALTRGGGVASADAGLRDAARACGLRVLPTSL